MPTAREEKDQQDGKEGVRDGGSGAGFGEMASALPRQRSLPSGGECRASVRWISEDGREEERMPASRLFFLLFSQIQINFAKVKKISILLANLGLEAGAVGQSIATLPPHPSKLA